MFCVFGGVDSLQIPDVPFVNDKKAHSTLDTVNTPSTRTTTARVPGRETILRRNGRRIGGHKPTFELWPPVSKASVKFRHKDTMAFVAQVEDVVASLPWPEAVVDG